MFFIGAAIILVFSFVIALLSLLREQRRVHKINQQHQTGLVVDQKTDVNTPAAAAVGQPVQSLEEVAKEPVAELPKVPDDTTASKARVDEDVVPFPWEAKTGVGNTITESQPRIIESDDRFPNVTGTVANQVSNQSQIPTAENFNGDKSPSVGLNGSVSLKDLKK